MPSRRSFLEDALAGLASLLAFSGTARMQGSPAMQQPTFRTALCDLLGIEYPILQAPMQFIASPRLVAAVCEAGGLGILAGIGVAPEELRRQITEVRGLTRKPFGVNLILHAALRPPVDTRTIPPETVREVNGILNRFRQRLGLAPRTDPPPPVPDLIPAAFDIIVQERVPLFSTGLGLPTAEMVERCHAAGSKVMCMVATVPDAREAERVGADIIAAQGAEAGGHRSLGVKPATHDAAAIGTMVLVPQVAEAVRAPVVAAGGISDGRGLAAAVMLGAVGALMGTRFIATADSAAPGFHKDALVAADSDATTLSDAFTGHYARFLRNTFIEEYRASGAPVFPPVVQQLASRDVVEAALNAQQPSFFPLYAGQGVGAIHNLPGAAEIVQRVVTEARDTLAAAGRRVRLE